MGKGNYLDVVWAQRRDRHFHLEGWSGNEPEEGPPSVSAFTHLQRLPWSSLPMTLMLPNPNVTSVGTFLNFSLVFNTLDYSTFVRYFLLPASIIPHSSAFPYFLCLTGYSFVNPFLGFSLPQNLRMLSCVTTFLFLLYIYPMYE